MCTQHGGYRDMHRINVVYVLICFEILTPPIRICLKLRVLVLMYICISLCQYTNFSYVLFDLIRRSYLDKCILINDLLLHLLFLINQLLVQADLLYHFERVIMI